MPPPPATRLAALVTVALLWTAGAAGPVLAQPAGNEMCGDGTTYRVELPVEDDSPGGGLLLPFATLRPDFVDLPKGCDVYLLIVSDVGRNTRLDELLFYPLAKLVAEHNGYVHYSWWNNLLKPYLGPQVHQAEDLGGAQIFETVNTPGDRFGGLSGLKDSAFVAALEHAGHQADLRAIRRHEIYQTECRFNNPSAGTVLGSILNLAGAAGCLALEAASDFYFAPSGRRPFPDSTRQLVADAAQFVMRTRSENPDALIVVAGHGVGAHAAALVEERLALFAGLPVPGVEPPPMIDLLALIGPYGSTSEPDGSEIDDSTLLGSRWRALYPIAGYARRDCVRSLPLVCQNFGTFFRPSYECFTRNELLSERPLVGSFAPLICPGAEVRHRQRPISPLTTRFLYHRWQNETGVPQDFLDHYGYHWNVPLPAPLPNAQELVPATFPGTTQAPGRLCSDAAAGDPRLPSLKCSPFDGHDELVGFRGLRSTPLPFGPFSLEVDLRVPLGVRAGEWTGGSGPPAMFAGDPLERRQAFIDMTAPDPDGAWVHRPAAPELCLVCDDLVAITRHLLETREGDDPAGPVTTAAIEPAANEAGWHSTDVLVRLEATAGAGVSDIQYALSGAQPGGTVTVAGDTAQVTVSAEGTTTMTYFARANDGEVEPPQTLEVSLDKTPPQIAAVTDVGPNANGWNRTDVLVAFEASDDRSGLASTTAATTASGEGAEQEIVGVAEDKAGNVASASAVLNIDKTPPLVALADRTPPNAAGWNSTDVSVGWTCADALSGPVAPLVAETLTAEGLAQVATGTCADRADNTASTMVTGIHIDKTPPGITITAPPDGAAYLLHAAVPSAYACEDGLSGVVACSGPVASGGNVDTSLAGARAFTVEGADAAGHLASATHAYQVHYDFSGFASPIAPMPTVNLVNAGRTVPVKYQLRDAHGALVTEVSSFSALVSAEVPCDSTAPDAPVADTDAAGSTAIRYDGASEQFVYNWKTTGDWAGTCRRLQLTLDDGTARLALFRFR
jgi:hypothetical protein